MLIVDAHLDLAYNAGRGRDVRRPASEQQTIGDEIATVGLPDLRAGNVSLICATIFCLPARAAAPGDGRAYHDAESARRQAMAQLDWYRHCIDQRLIRFVRNADELPRENDDRPQAAILLMEGADPIRSAADIAAWFEAGVRIVGLSWRATRFAGGTGEPGSLTDAGVELVCELDRFKIIHDASHLAEESFWKLLEISGGPVIASHSNCRSIVPTDRQLSDDMMRAIFKRDGIVGINFFDKFLLKPAEYDHRRATLADVVTHVRMMCDLAGDTAHVGLGTDMDGGLGREQIPEEIRTIADLSKLADALSAANFSDVDVENILGGNWMRYFSTHLPKG
jgi:membrane dipeptidase